MQALHIFTAQFTTLHQEDEPRCEALMDSIATLRRQAALLRDDLRAMAAAEREATTVAREMAATAEACARRVRVRRAARFQATRDQASQLLVEQQQAAAQRHLAVFGGSGSAALLVVRNH